MDTLLCAGGCRCQIPHPWGAHSLVAVKTDSYLRATEKRTQQHGIKCYRFSEARKIWAPQRRLGGRKRERVVSFTLEGRNRHRWRQRKENELLRGRTHMICSWTMMKRPYWSEQTFCAVFRVLKGPLLDYAKQREEHGDLMNRHINAKKAWLIFLCHSIIHPWLLLQKLYWISI